MFKSFTVSAPAKVNLYLHITGRLDNGHHTLESLVAFSSIGDILTIEPADQFSFHIKGPFSQFLGREDPADNLVVRAAQNMAAHVRRDLNMTVTLKKNLPVAAGLGGGSSDAAAILRALVGLWGGEDLGPSDFESVFNDLGADLPVCYAATPQHVSGYGERLSPVSLPHNIPVVLVNPGVPCPTGPVFQSREGNYTPWMKGDIPDLKTLNDLASFMQGQRNDLYSPALKIVPDIEKVVKTLENQSGCLVARMSGSGATCFGIFDHKKAADNTALVLQINHPDWWVRSGFLNERAYDFAEDIEGLYGD